MIIDVELRIKDGEPILNFHREENLSGDVLEILFEEIQNNGSEIYFEKTEEGICTSISLKSKKV